MVFDRDTTVRSRELGQILREAPKTTGHNAQEVSVRLGWVPAKVSNLLTGKRIPQPVDVAAFLMACEVVGPRRDAIRELAQHALETTRWQDHTARRSLDRVTLTDNVAIATEVIAYGNALVPDLLRTSAYSRALLRTLPTVTAADIEQRLTGPARRQLILDRCRAPQLRAFVDECVLTRNGAGDVVMGEQANHLLRMSAQPNIDIRLVSDGSSIAQVSGFTLLRFRYAPPVVHFEFLTSSAFTEGAETMKAYDLVVTALDRLALDPASSLAALTEIAEQRAARASATTCPPPPFGG